jgi:hypothetical protein
MLDKMMYIQAVDCTSSIHHFDSHHYGKTLETVCLWRPDLQRAATSERAVTAQSQSRTRELFWVKHMLLYAREYTLSRKKIGKPSYELDPSRTYCSGKGTVNHVYRSTWP